MGGDNAPAEIVSGVIKALEEFKDIEFYITGPEESIKKEIAKNNNSKKKQKETQRKSKFFKKYQERIDSIKESDLKLKQKTLKEKNIK